METLEHELCRPLSSVGFVVTTLSSLKYLDLDAESYIFVFPCFLFFYSYTIYYPCTTFLAPLLTCPVETQIRGHMEGSPPPSPPRYVPSFSTARINILAVYSLIDSRQINCAFPRCYPQHLIDPFFYLKSQISPRRMVGIKLKDQR